MSIRRDGRDFEYKNPHSHLHGIKQAAKVVGHTVIEKGHAVVDKGHELLHRMRHDREAAAAEHGGSISLSQTVTVEDTPAARSLEQPGESSYPYAENLTPDVIAYTVHSYELEALLKGVDPEKATKIRDLLKAFGETAVALTRSEEEGFKMAAEPAHQMQFDLNSQGGAQ